MKKKLKLRRINSGYYETNIVLVGDPELKIYIERNMDDPKSWDISYVWDGYRTKREAVKSLKELMEVDNGEFKDGNFEPAKLEFRP